MEEERKECEILLVEDNRSDAELAIRALKKVNLTNHLVHVRDGVEALDFLFGKDTFAMTPMEAKSIKVILLDIKMPRLNGIEVLKELKQNENTKSIPVVIMTSSKEDEDIIKSYKLGVNSFVVKPVDFNNFSKAVSDLGMYWMLTNQPPL